MTGLYCYDMRGNLQWEKDLGNYKMRAGWGTAVVSLLNGANSYIVVRA